MPSACCSRLPPKALLSKRAAKTILKVQVSPQDSRELDTPQMRKYFVKGGPESHGQHGFIFSNANWDPHPLANDVEAFTVALANMDVAVVQRIYRFSSAF